MFVKYVGGYTMMNKIMWLHNNMRIINIVWTSIVFLGFAWLIKSLYGTPIFQSVLFMIMISFGLMLIDNLFPYKEEEDEIESVKNLFKNIIDKK